MMLTGFRDWIHSIGIWGMVVFIIIYAIATVLAIPGSTLIIAAGSLFGSVKGVIIVSIASTTGAGLAFLAARYFVRDFIQDSIGKNDKFKKIDVLTEKHGSIIVAITRLVPILPYTWLNYGFGFTKIPFWVYLFWSWLCMLPGTVFYVVGTDAVVKGMSNGEIPWILVGILIVTLILIILLVKNAKKKLQE